MVTFAPLNLLGVTPQHHVARRARALGIGMLVDSSIVVLESIFRCREEGDDVITAAVRGTREVRGAVIASTLTSIAVFFPMVFVEGVAGQAFGDLGSGRGDLVARVAGRRGGLHPDAGEPRRPRPLGLPTRQGTKLWRLKSPGRLRDDWRASVGWLKSGRAPLKALPWLLFVDLPRAAVRHPLAARDHRPAAPFDRFRAVPRRLAAAVAGPQVGLLLRHRCCRSSWSEHSSTGSRAPIPVACAGRCATRVRDRGAGGGLLFGLTAWLASRLDSELLPEVHQGEFTVEVALPVGTPLEETDDVLAPVEEAILAERESIKKLLLTVGYDAASSQRSDEGEHTARFKVLLDSSDPALERQVIARLRQRFADIPDVEARVVTAGPVQLQDADRGGDPRRRSGRAAPLRRALPRRHGEHGRAGRRRHHPASAGAPEVQIVYDRDRLARYELNISQVAQLVRNAVAGFEATRFNLQDRRIPILVRFDETDRSTVDDVRDLVVNPGAVTSVLDPVTVRQRRHDGGFGRCRVGRSACRR